MYAAGRYNLNFNISTVVLSAICVYFYCLQHKQMRMREKLFRALLVTLGISSGLEYIFLLMENNAQLFSYAIALTAKFFSLLTHSLLPYLVAQYVIHVVGINYYASKKAKVLFAIPLILSTAALLFPITGRMMFTLGADGAFTTGPLFTLIYIQVDFYLIVAAVLMIQSRKILNISEYVSTICAIVVGILSLFLDIKYPYLKASNFIQMMLMLVTMLSMENGYNFIDSITGLRNSNSLDKDAQIMFGGRYSSYALMIKIQNFANHRAIYGRTTTNALLKEIALFLLTQTTYHRSFYYLGHGVFGILIFNGEEAKVDELSTAILERFKHTWRKGFENISLGVQIWRADIPSKIENMNALRVITDAPFDPAFGVDCIITNDHIADQERRVTVERAVNRAVREDAFEVYYQPIYDLREHRIRSAEALIRLNDPEIGFIPPDEFIPLVEENGAISIIGEMVFEKTCQFLAANKIRLNRLDFVEVNLSTIQSLDETLPERLLKIAQRYDIHPSRICLEITETGMIYNQEAMLQTVSRLRAYGFTFALDDFGTGHSNFAYIFSFPVSIIKIDKEILWSADHDTKKAQILEHLIKISKELDCQVVVEGVEKREHVEKLDRLGVEYLQGFYFSKALPEKKFIEYMRGY